MISKGQIKKINRLKLKKGRLQNRQFIVEGVKMIDELLKSNYKIFHVFGTEKWYHENFTQNLEFDFTIISQNELKKISSLNQPNEVLAIVELPIAPTIDHSILINNLVLAFDNLQDPGNLGTILRTADWFGIKHIICSDNCVDIYNSKVVQASMGSIFRVDVSYLNLIDFLNTLPENIPVFGTFIDGQNIYSLDKKISKKGMIIFGNESQGISDDVSQYIPNKLSIPRFNNTYDTPESLNVGSSVAIICSILSNNH